MVPDSTFVSDLRVASFYSTTVEHLDSENSPLPIE